MFPRLTCVECGITLTADQHILCDDCLYDEEGLFEDEEPVD